MLQIDLNIQLSGKKTNVLHHDSYKMQDFMLKNTAAWVITQKDYNIL